ncbi:M23 family metallopeptidase [Streptomyces sp. KK5PA1]|uniref:M23 family metallopeptidase n=2 Tax=Actinacidiphila acididurans TaxID=2784346 RepID=A0ABS2TMX6_9ACTN|nr:M23 family metallopeptidase [Actinacidiphila acididurans]
MFEQVAYAAGPGTGYEQDLTAEFGTHSGGHTGYEPQSAQDPSTALMDPVTDTGLAAEADPATDFTAFTAFPDDLAHDGAPEDIEARHDYAADGPAGDDGMAARSRRRKPAKRSALLTIAVPSVAVMGVAAVGAAAVGGVGVAQGSNKAQADGPDAAATTATGNAPTTQLDRQLSGVSRQADDFATRASRTQERIDLKDRQAAAAKARAEAAARAEALRPKFVLPVTQKGLSAYFGQAGEHWMMLHTGIDFPVQVGTPVMAATDGTVRTQWNPSYGNMAIVTAPDGTETWYCHLSSTKIRSGKVQAGTVIAYSGNTGNTTGPHLHFEVRPGGGSPIDPLPWLLAHGLDPR